MLSLYCICIVHIVHKYGHVCTYKCIFIYKYLYISTNTIYIYTVTLFIYIIYNSVSIYTYSNFNIHKVNIFILIYKKGKNNRRAIDVTKHRLKNYEYITNIYNTYCLYFKICICICTCVYINSIFRYIQYRYIYI